jgi:hypothetical protein
MGTAPDERYVVMFSESSASFGIYVGGSRRRPWAAPSLSPERECPANRLAADRRPSESSPCVKVGLPRPSLPRRSRVSSSSWTREGALSLAARLVAEDFR